jgi:hypothetical protein
VIRYCVILLLFLYSTASAQERVILFDVESSEELKGGYVMLIGDEGGENRTIERRVAEILPKGKRQWQVRVRVSPQESVHAAQAVFFGKTTTGGTVATEVRSLRDSGTALPPGAVICNSDPTIFDAGVLSKFNAEEMKVFLEVKRQRTRILADRVRLLLTPTTVTALNELEQEFGLASTEPLRVGMPYEELVRRLALLQAVVPK